MSIAAQNDVGHADRRDVWQSLRRGFLGRCPHCGDGRLFGRYLKVVDRCASCGEAMHHQRADDAPPYVTMLVVAHIVGALVLFADERFASMPLWGHIVLWPIVVFGLSLALLPRVKGALVGLQWALRMHGFDDAGEDETLLTSRPA